jgi:hypothetical protein
MATPFRIAEQSVFVSTPRFVTTEAPQPPIRLRQYCPSQASIFIAWGE